MSSRQTLAQNASEFSEMRVQLAKFRSLPADRRFLANLKPQDIFDALAVLVKDPSEVFQHCEKAWHEGCFEKIILKKYGS
jgi:hypothetical protein